ncbi:hypothetical protein EDC01DRAFT_643024 [Geopyxis carbonaria]|nr:hypothetical protein EDC01DRAFT_643024 [Geopyxis carbonaria]
MSQDLLSEFDSFYQPPKKLPSKTLSSVKPNFPRNARGHQHSASSTTFEDLLGISSFPGEPGYNRPQGKLVDATAQQYRQRPVSYHGGNHNSEPGRFKATPELNPFASSRAAHGQTQSSSLSFQQEDEDEDGFGEFATALVVDPTYKPPGISQPFENVSMLQLNHKLSSIKPIEDEDFGDFITSPVTSPPSYTAPRPEKRLITLSDSFSESPAPSSRRRPLRPTIDEFPPVVILLSKFPSLFLLPEIYLLDRLKGLSFALRQRVLSDSTTRDFLQSICELGRVAGRIIAGRCRRRSIGAPKGSGGMKVGIIKSNSSFEAQKEEREVKEICRLWKEGCGRLRAAIGEAVPVLYEDQKLAPTSNPTCRLCKLSQDEVLSSLKEPQDKPKWWNSTWGGHGSCKGFWDAHGEEIKMQKY